MKIVYFLNVHRAKYTLVEKPQSVHTNTFQTLTCTVAKLFFFFFLVVQIKGHVSVLTVAQTKLVQKRLLVQSCSLSDSKICIYFNFVTGELLGQESDRAGK